MALRDKLAKRVQPLLNEGEKVEQVFVTQTGASPWLMGFAGGLLIMLIVKRRIVAVTDQRIVVLEAGRFSGTAPKKVLGELPRQTQLGPVNKLWSKIELNGEKNWVNRRFKKDIDEADAALAVPPPSGEIPG
jgi:hypothetical protein